MRRVNLGSVSVVDFKELPTRCEGISTYKGILVLWDEDFDTRVLNVIDALDRGARCLLVAISEHEGGVEFFWNNAIVPVPEWEQELEVPDDGDVWQVEHHFMYKDEL